MSQIELTSLQVWIDAPLGASVSKAPLGDEILVNFGECSLIVGSSPIHSTPEEARASAVERAGRVYSEPKDFQSSRLGEGFIATYYTDGDIGREFHVESRIVVGAQSFRCDMQSVARSCQDAAVQMCQSLRK